MRKSTLLSLNRPKPARSEISVGLPIDTDHLSPHQTKNLVHELQVHQIELKLQNEELRRTHAELETSNARYFDLYDLAPVGYITIDENGLILEGNLFAATMLDVPKGTLVKQPLTRFIFKEDQDLYYKHCKQLFGTGGPRTVELRMVKKNGSQFWVRLDSTMVQNAGRMLACRVVVSDITERKRAEEREQLTRDVLELLNHTGDTTGTISDILKLVKNGTGFEAVGIRLRNGDDFPYYETNGFPGHFVESERRLCAYDEKGNIIRDKAGNPVLECMCGNIIRGRTDPTQPFFTRGGSFWSNGTTKLLASTTEKDRQARTRNRCNGEGYESVALIPLRSGNEIVGLLQLNDRRKGQFTIEVIQFFEGLGAAIGIALFRKRSEEALRESEERYRRITEGLSDYFYTVQIQDGRVVKTTHSMACKAVTGYSAEELASDPYLWINMVPEKERGLVIEHVRNILSGKEIPAIEHRIERKDGAIRWVSDTPIRKVDAQGTLLSYDGVIKDITERKKAEEDLAFKNTILSTQQEVSIDGILVVDEHGRMISSNRRFADLWEIPPSVIESKSGERALQSVMDKLADPGEFINKVKHLYDARNETSRDEISLKDGRTFDRYSAPMLGAGGQVLWQGLVFPRHHGTQAGRREPEKARGPAPPVPETRGHRPVVQRRGA